MTATISRSALGLAPTVAPLVAINPLVAQTITFSAPLDITLRIYRGDTGRFRITVTEVDGTPFDLSAATWDCDIRSTADGTTVVANLTPTPVSGDTSSMDFVLTAAESAKLVDAAYVYDVQMTLGIEVQTLIAGMVLVTKDVSRTP